MAIARCAKCASVGLKLSYLHSQVLSEGCRLMCGALKCTRPARYIWLSDAELAEYNKGQRSFMVVRQGSVDLPIEVKQSEKPPG